MDASECDLGLHIVEVLLLLFLLTKTTLYCNTCTVFATTMHTVTRGISKQSQPINVNRSS